MRRSTATLLLAPLCALFLAPAATPVAAQEAEEAGEHEKKSHEMVVELSPLGDSGVHGTATISAMKKGKEGREAREEGGEKGYDKGGEKAKKRGHHGKKMHPHRVTLELEGLAAGQSHPAHIHRGSCDSPGGVAIPLEAVTAGDDGTGSSTTTITPEQMKEAHGGGDDAKKGEGKKKGEKGKHHPSLLIMVHQPGGTPAACGDISAEGHRGKEHEGGKEKYPRGM